MSFAKSWELVDLVLRNSRRVLLYGPPGTGKTYAATRLGLDPGQTVYSVTLQEETPAAELRGHFVPDGEKFLWMDGPAVLAWTEPAPLVLNEIDHASADALSFLHVILDDPEFTRLTLPTGKTITPKPGFRVVATMNGTPDDLPPALLDRFPVQIELVDVNPEAVAALPTDLREIALKTANLRDHRRIGIRAWMEYANLRNKIGKEAAAQAVMGRTRAQDMLDSLAIANI